MEKPYFLVPNTGIAKAIVDDFRDAGISEQHTHVVAKDSVTLDQLPKASLLEESDFVPALKRGAAAGGGVGLLAGLAAVTFPPAGIALGGGALLGLLLVEAEGKHPERIRQTVLKYHPSASFESTQDTVTPVV